MKRKTIFFTLLLCLLMSSYIHAQIKLSGWGKVIITPFAMSSKFSSVSADTTTWDDRPRVGITILGEAESGKIGFCIDPNWDGGVPGVSGNAKIWIKPFSFLKITAGTFEEDDFRGQIGTTEFASWLLPSGGGDEDTLFTRFEASSGVLFTIMPIKGLFIEAALGSNRSGPGGVRAPRNIVDMFSIDVYKSMQVGVGYHIPNIGFVRAQWIGNNRKQLVLDDNNVLVGEQLMQGLLSNIDADVIEAAFQLIAVKGLNLDIGVKIPLKFKTDTTFVVYPALNPWAPVINADGQEITVQMPYGVSLALTYAPVWLEGFSIMTRVDASFGGWVLEEGVYRLEHAPVISFWFNPAYAITSKVSVGIDFGLETKTADRWQQPLGRIDQNRTKGSNYLDFGVGAWGMLNVGGGTIKAGAMLMLSGNERWRYNAGNTKKPFSQLYTGDPILSFPISVIYNF